jgi:hypothetical protein
MYRSSTSFAFLYALCFAAVTSSLRAANEFNLSGTGDLADSVNWSDGAPPAPGTPGFISGSGNSQAFLSENLSTGTWNFVRPSGELNIDLQGNTLTSSGLFLKPTPSSLVGPLTAGLVVHDGTVHSKLELRTDVQGNLQPKTINATISNVDWTGEEWLILGKPSIPGSGFESTGRADVTIDQGSKVTLDRLLVGMNSTVKVTGPDTELAFKKAFILPSDSPDSVSLFSVLGGIRNQSEIHVENGATIRTLATNPPANLGLLYLATAAFARVLELDGPNTRLVAPSANIAATELRISNGAAIETDRPVYIVGAVDISHTTTQHDLVSIFGPMEGFIFSNIGREHAVNLKSATLIGSISGFNLVDLDDAVIDGDIEDVVAIRGEGSISGNASLGKSSFSPDPRKFLPTGLIDVNGNVAGNVFVDVVLTGPPSANPPQVEVDSIDQLTTLFWSPYTRQPLHVEVAFDPLFHASVGDRFELVRSVETILNPGFRTPGDFLSFPIDVREYVEERLSGIVFQTKPAGYDFNIFIEPHAIGFTVVSVPELSSLALITPPLVVMAIFEARRRRHRRAIVSGDKRFP